VSDESAKQEDRQRAPDSSISLAVKKRGGYDIEQWARRSKIKETIGLTGCEHVGAMFSEAAPVVA
jgi:hypothetical protein